MMWMLLMLCSLHSVSALQCYQCFSYSSLEDCSKTQGVVQCEPGQTRCKNTTVSYFVDIAFVQENITGYARGCETENNCNDNKCLVDFGKKLGASDYNACEVSCCEGNLCPAANSTSSSEVVVRGPRGGSTSITAGFFSQIIAVSSMFWIRLSV